jgi:hypothetical protein
MEDADEQHRQHRVQQGELQTPQQRRGWDEKPPHHGCHSSMGAESGGIAELVGRLLAQGKT